MSKKKNNSSYSETVEDENVEVTNETDDNIEESVIKETTDSEEQVDETDKYEVPVQEFDESEKNNHRIVTGAEFEAERRSAVETISKCDKFLKEIEKLQKLQEESRSAIEKAELEDKIRELKKLLESKPVVNNDKKENSNQTVLTRGMVRVNNSTVVNI